MPRTFRFLCGNINTRGYIYATKFGRNHWHYFEELHCIISEHDTLPEQLKNLIKTITRLETIEVYLNDDQVKDYYKDEKFVFKNIELKTFKELTNQNTIPKETNTRQLTFDSGVTNPLLFLAEFEKCCDIENDQDKTYKIRHFVDFQHKAEFSHFHFNSDWPTSKAAFISKYSLPFIENKKKEININFSDEPSLRSFVNRKFDSLAKYTTLPFINQMEIVLNELPNDIAHLFMVNEKFDCDKNDILDFCDAIQEMVEKHIEDKNIQGNVIEPSNRMEVFRYETDHGDDDGESVSQASSSRGRGRGRGRAATGMIEKYPIRKRKLVTIPENQNISDMEDDSEYDFMDQVSNSSQSSNSTRSSSKSFLSSHSSNKSFLSSRKSPRSK